MVKGRVWVLVSYPLDLVFGVRIPGILKLVAAANGYVEGSARYRAKKGIDHTFWFEDEALAESFAEDIESLDIPELTVIRKRDLSTPVRGNGL